MVFFLLFTTATGFGAVFYDTTTFLAAAFLTTGAGATFLLAWVAAGFF